jgi:L-asparaginase II
MYERLAEVLRGDVVESVHFGVAAVANADGEIIEGWGDPALLTFPRSSLKPFQAIALVETGAFDAFHLTTQHLALASASHRGESFHISLVKSWLAQLELDEHALVCGPIYPRDPDAAGALMRDGIGESRMFHGCSGKHCGFLTVCKHRGWSTEDYGNLEHPSQQLFLDVLSEFAQTSRADIVFGVDGCALPAAALTVGDTARALARFAAGRATSAARRAAVVAVQNAMRSFPEYVSGADQPTPQLVRATGGRVIVKTGAEGFLAAYIPDQQLGIAIKVADGNPRVRFVALIAMLERLDLLTREEAHALHNLAHPPVFNSGGAIVGSIHDCLPSRSALNDCEG